MAHDHHPASTGWGQMIGTVCSLLSLNNKQSDTTPVSSWPPLWPDWYRVEAAGSTLKDTQPVDHILSSDTHTRSLHNVLHNLKGALPLFPFWLQSWGITVCDGGISTVYASPIRMKGAEWWKRASTKVKWVFSSPDKVLPREARARPGSCWLKRLPERKQSIKRQIQIYPPFSHSGDSQK